MGPVGVRRRGPITGSGTGCDTCKVCRTWVIPKASAICIPSLQCPCALGESEYMAWESRAHRAQRRTMAALKARHDCALRRSWQALRGKRPTATAEQ